MAKVEEMTFKRNYNKYLNRVHKVEMLSSQTYFKHCGQIDDKMKGSLTEDPKFERAHQEKDVLKLRKLLKNISFNYKRGEEPITTLWQVDKDVINLRQ